jgi:hypothetical protein
MYGKLPQLLYSSSTLPHHNRSFIRHGLATRHSVSDDALVVLPLGYESPLPFARDQAGAQADPHSWAALFGSVG